MMSWSCRVCLILIPKRPAPFPRFLFAALILSLVSFLTAGTRSSYEISYSEHCKDIVPEPSLRPEPNPPLWPRSLAIGLAYVGYRGNSTKGISVIPRSISFVVIKAYRTQNDAVFKIEGSLNLIGFRGGHGYIRDNSTRRGLRLVKFRPPRIPLTSVDHMNAFRFSLNGFWDWSSGKLCMIGSGFDKLSSNHGVLKLDYLNSSSIFNSLVNGTFERLDLNENGFNHNLITILGVNLRNYKYELIDKEIAIKGFSLLGDSSNNSLGVADLGENPCSFIAAAGSVVLKYMSDCSKVNCNFLGGGNDNFTPSMMNFKLIECAKDGRVRFLLEFGEFGQQLSFEPNVTLVSEGKWDEKKRRLDMVGCRIFSDWDEGFVGECLIRLSLRFPAKWTLRDRSTVVGMLWSSRGANETGYFGSVMLTSTKNSYFRGARLKYEYKEIEHVRRSCANKTTQKGGGRKFPDGLSSDLRFDMVVGSRKIKNLWGYSSPLYVEDRLYEASHVVDWEEKSTRQMKKNGSSVMNVSYVLRVRSSHDFKLSSEYMQIKSFEISAEGLYDSKNGHLCMVGCLYLVRSPNMKLGHNSLDCEILVNIQYPPLHSKNLGTVKGTIESTRKKSDRFYFEPFYIFSGSIYSGQAKESMWRMDLEIAMVLISNTLSCVFVCLQLLHIKRHAIVLRFISITMLVILTLAHMIPLLLNFEALFLVSHRGMDAYFSLYGWLEVNEVLVRVITMIAFLLEFRLLQLTWGARSADESQKNLWISEKNVIYLSLPMYICGGLIAWFVHLSRKSSQKPSLRNRHFVHEQISLWGDLKSYTGLILDGFLLPQILFNLFCDTKEAALSPSFYLGTTFVRLLPHAYDLYRSHSSSWSLNYIFANPRMDYYSTTWDIIISIGGLLFAFLIYLQQRYGGGCLLPKRFRQTSMYEKVPVTSA